MKDNLEVVKTYIDVIWHFWIEDHLSFDFCAKIVRQDEGLDITGDELEELCFAYFKNETGIMPYTECPLCGAKTVLRRNEKGYFVGCSNFPECDFLASKARKFTTKEKYLKMVEKESKVIEQAKSILTAEGEVLYGWMQGNVKIVNGERLFIKSRKGYTDKLTYAQARRTLSIYKKAKTLGYPEKKPELYKDKLTANAEYIEKQIDIYYNRAKHDNPQISRDEAKREYSNIYKNSYGISFDVLCPKCKSPLKLVENRVPGELSHFIGCSNYPACDFFANKYNKALTEDERKQEREIINKVLSIPTNVWIDLCCWLESQRHVESKKKFPNWYATLNSVKEITGKINKGLSITGQNANRLIDILEKATSFGFEEKNGLPSLTTINH